MRIKKNVICFLIIFCLISVAFVSGSTSLSGKNVKFSSYEDITATNVQDAIDQLYNYCFFSNNEINSSDTNSSINAQNVIKTSVGESEADNIQSSIEEIYNICKNTYKITLNAGSGTLDNNEVFLRNGEEYGVLPTPVYPTYWFDGWYLNSDFTGNPIQASDVFDLKKDTVLYAKYSPPQDLFTFIKNQKIASSTTLNFNNSSLYNYTNSGERPGVYQYNTSATEYFYRGNVSNNVIFGNFCWKLVRTTSTSGIKIIYNGIAQDGKCLTQSGDDTEIGKSQYWASSVGTSNIPYVGSLLKTYIETWYAENMLDYATYLEDTVWCNDTSTYTDSNRTYAPGDYTVKYSVLKRASYLTYSGVKPSLTCNGTKLSVSAKNIKYPVALITLDEVAMAGATSGYNSNKTSGERASEYWTTDYYLNTYNHYWTLTPVRGVNGTKASNTTAQIGKVHEDKYLGHESSDSSLGVRPTVSLKKGTQIYGHGDGTPQNPYIVVLK